MQNPFFPDFSIDINTLPSRQNLLKKIYSWISYGQSVLIVSEPWMKKGKFLLDIPTQTEFVNSEWKLIFSFIDVSTLDTGITESDFWKMVFEPLEKYITESEIKASVVKQFSYWQNNRTAVSLGPLLEQMEKNQVRLVLLIDEFNLLTHHPALGNPAVFGWLRSLATRSGLVFIAAGRSGVSELHSETSEINKFGSPYFNFLVEARLGVLSERDMSILLGETDFSKQDKLFAINVSGGHPHILQIVASLLWEKKSDRYENPLERYKEIGKLILEQTRGYYESIWNLWTDDIQKSLISVAVIQVPDLFKNFRFESKNFFGNLPEIYYLSSIGIIEIKNTASETYIIKQGALLWWLSEKISQILRPDTELKQWLREKQLVGAIFTNQDIDQIGKAAEYLGKVLDKGVVTLVEAYSKAIIK